jgi:hypothetical protein
MSTWTQSSPVYLNCQITTLADRRDGEIKRLGKVAAIAGAA